MKRIVNICFLGILCVPLLTGCWDSNEPEKLAYSHGIGIDYKDNQYIFYAQAINYGKIAKTEAAGGTVTIPEEVGRVSGTDVDQALKNLYRVSQRRIYWGHVKFVVLTEEALKHNTIQQITDLLNRFREFRYRIWVYSTKEELTKVLLSHPGLENSSALNELADPTSSTRQLFIIHPITMRELQIELNEPGHQAVIPMVTVGEKQWKSEDKKRTAIEFKGAAIVTSTQLKGFITGQDMRGFRWMTKDPSRIDVQIMKNENPVSLVIVEKPKVSITPIVNNKKVTFDITVKAPGTLTEMDQEDNETYTIEEMNTIIKNEIKRTFEKGLNINADVYHLSEVLYRKNVKVWKEIENNGMIPLQKDSISIHVDSKIKNSGKMQDTPSL